MVKKCFFFVCVLSWVSWSVSHLLKAKRQCLFYNPYINVRHRKFIIVGSVLFKCRRFTFPCFSLLYKMPPLKRRSYSTSRLYLSLLPLVPSLRNCCIYIISLLLHWHSAPNTVVYDIIFAFCTTLQDLDQFHVYKQLKWKKKSLTATLT